jgi:hypothetical protein
MITCLSAVMNALTALLLSAALFMAGCTAPAGPEGEKPVPPPQPPASETPPPTCTEYCQTQPHIQCVGKWVVSGTYPNCVCGFECENETGNGKPETNMTPPPPANVTPPSPQTNVTNKSLGQLLADGLDRAESRFYKVAEAAEWKVETFQWAMMSPGDLPDAVPLKENDLRASSVRFPDMYIDSLRGFAVRVYSAPDLYPPSKYYATGIFIDDATAIDALESGKIDIKFDFHPERTQILEDCSVVLSENFITPSGTPVKIYDFSCKIMYGATS